MDEEELGHAEDVVMWLRAGAEMTYTAADVIDALLVEVRRLQQFILAVAPGPCVECGKQGPWCRC